MTSLVPSDVTKRSLEENIGVYETQMDGAAVEYLTKRGITKEAAGYFRLGLVADPLPGDDSFQGRIAIPYLTPAGVVAVKYRAIDDRNPKYLTSVGAQMKRFYNPKALLKPYMVVYLCEGEIDTITAAMCGLPAIGVPGVKAWEKKMARALRNRKVIVLADGDDSGEGKQFADRVLHDVDDGGMVLFDGCDVNSFFVEHGRKGLRERLGLKSERGRG